MSWQDGEAPTGDTGGVHLRQLVVGGLPLIVAGTAREGLGARLRDRLVTLGLAQLESFLGARLPQGARVGFVLDSEELRLVDDRDDTLLRAPRSGVDDAWLAEAKRLRGTMVVLAAGLELDATTSPRDIARTVDELARQGDAIGAVVGVVEERPGLPLLL